MRYSFAFLVMSFAFVEWVDSLTGLYIHTHQDDAHYHLPSYMYLWALSGIWLKYKGRL